MLEILTAKELTVIRPAVLSISQQRDLNCPWKNQHFTELFSCSAHSECNSETEVKD